MAYAIDQAIRALGKNAKIEEWYEYGGHPYRFRITGDLQPNQVFRRADMRRLIRLALRTKNVRSYLDYVGLARSVSGALYVGAFIRSRVTVTIGPTVTTGLTVRPYLKIGAAVTVRSVTTIYPGEEPDDGSRSIGGSGKDCRRHRKPDGPGTSAACGR